MKTPMARILLVAGALVAGAAAARAEEIYLEDGRVVHGEILEVREDGIRAKGKSKDGGMMDIVIRDHLLDAEWYYGLRDKAAGEDAGAHIKLALWAIDKGLFNRAQAQVNRANALDPELVKKIQEGKLPEIREGIAAKILESARADEKAGKLEMAQRKVELVLARMPDTPAGVEAADYLPEVCAKVAEKEVKDAAEARAKLAEKERKAEEERDRLVNPVEEALAKGRALGQEALREDNQPKALGMLGKALEMGNAALERLETLAKSKYDDEVLGARIKDLRATIAAAMVKGYLHSAEMYIWRGSLTQAKAEVAKVTALDPGNSDAAALLDRIEDTEKGLNDEQRWRRGGFGGESRFKGGRGGGGGRGR